MYAHVGKASMIMCNKWCNVGAHDQEIAPISPPPPCRGWGLEIETMYQAIWAYFQLLYVVFVSVCPFLQLIYSVLFLYICVECEGAYNRIKHTYMYIVHYWTQYEFETLPSKEALRSQCVSTTSEYNVFLTTLHFSVHLVWVIYHLTPAN